MRGDDEGLVAEGVERAFDHAELAALAVMQHRRADAVAAVLPVAAIDLDRGRERLPARQPLDDIGVAGRRQRVGRPVGGDEQMVLVLPVDAMLAARQVEAAVDEAHRVEIELAHLGRVFAAVRQRDEAAALVGAQAGHALHHPALALRLAERVDVEHGRPVRIGSAIVGERRLAPQAAQMIGILPEIVDFAVHEIGRGDAVLGAGDRERLLVERGVARIGLEDLRAGGIVRVDPRHRARRGDVLEPEIGIVADGRRCQRGGGDEGEETEGQHRSHVETP